MMYSDPADCPYYLITRTSLSLTASLKREFSNSGIEEVRPAYLGVLMCLWMTEGMDETLGKLGSEDGIKLTELGRCAGLEPSTMTGLVDRMERDGLVYRANDPNDRRAQKVNLTQKGLHVRSLVFHAVEKMLRNAFAGIEADHMEIAKKVLKQILLNTNKGSI
jgi:DNA-binding MarR family transcriptional regulator